VTTVNLLNPFWFGTPAIHSYWRLYILAVGNGDVVRIQELEMAATAGGANQCTGGTASASSFFDGTKVPANAFDGTNTEWMAAETAAPNLGGGGWDEWVQYEFPAPVGVAEIRIRGSDLVTNGSPYAFTLLGSNDGVNWTAYLQVFGETSWSLDEQRTYAVPSTPIDLSAAPRIWFIEVVANDGGTGGWGVTEIALADSAAGASIATGGKAISQPWFIVLPPLQAFDGSSFTEYGSNGGNYRSGFIAYELVTGSALHEVRITSRAGIAASQAPRTFNIKSSVDGYHFTTERAVASSSGWGSAETRTFVL
jgi:hypothetical protein